ncbi:MAG TPA: plastocyanin/azurin family copper-binding protein [Candidatus Bathyarchaeia archaeon]|nr:plastocyanin/azurin family copper-binding protein [Candidatus Bathyarchaeia archaeon]
MKEIQQRVLILAVVVTAIVVTATVGYIYVGSLSSANPIVTVVRIPKDSSAEPTGFNVNYFQANFVNGTYPFPVNISVTIGVNNTIEWVNDDVVGHTVTALVAPSGGPRFNSGIIFSGKTFSVTLTVAGVYRYTCAWHQWLAGQIIVKPPS